MPARISQTTLVADTRIDITSRVQVRGQRGEDVEGEETWFSKSALFSIQTGSHPLLVLRRKGDTPSTGLAQTPLFAFLDTAFRPGRSSLLDPSFHPGRSPLLLLLWEGGHPYTEWLPLPFL